MHKPRPLKGTSIAAMAAAGVVLGHWLAYVLAVPQPQARAAILVESGHSYWLAAVKLAVVLGISALGAVAVRQFIGRRQDAPSRSHPLTRLTIQLTLLQVAAFTAMEVAERLASHAPVAQMFSHHIFFVGVAVQFLVAFAGAIVLRWFGRAVTRLVEALAPRPLPRLAVLRVRSVAQPFRPVPVLTGAAGVRGPPSP